VVPKKRADVIMAHFYLVPVLLLTKVPPVAATSLAIITLRLCHPLENF